MRKRPKSSPPPIPPAPASQLIPALTIFAAALVLRLLAAWQLGSLPLSRTPQLDSAAYLMWARAIVDGGLAWPPYPEHAPGYPFFLAAILALFDGSLMAVRVVQSVLGAIACVLTARVASRTVGPGAFLWAGLLQAAYGPLIYLDTALLAESLLVFLLVLTLDVITAADRRSNRWLIGGVVLGAACVVRPTALALVPAFLIVLAGRHRWNRETLIPAVAFAGGVLVFVAPVTIQNWRVAGVPMIQAYGGMNAYLGNRPSGDGAARARPGGEWDRLEAEASRAGASRNDQDRYYLRRAVTEISEQPSAYVALLAAKLWWTLQDEELRDTHSYYFFADAWAPLRWLPSFGLMIALAVAALTAARPRDPAWLIAYGAAMLATIVFLVVGTRYRIPLVPVVLAMAGSGVAAIIGTWRARNWKTMARLGAVFVLAWLAAESWRDAASRNLAEEQAMTGLSLLQEGRFGEAERAYRVAIATDPDSSFAWDGLGLALQRLLSRAEARAAFERAVQINPSNAAAWLHLGYAHELLRDPEAALRAYEQALTITPQRAEAQQLYEAARRRYR